MASLPSQKNTAPHAHLPTQKESLKADEAFLEAQHDHEIYLGRLLNPGGGGGGRGRGARGVGGGRGGGGGGGGPPSEKTHKKARTMEVNPMKALYTAEEGEHGTSKDVTKAGEDVTKEGEDVTKEGEDGTKEGEDVTKAAEDVTKAAEECEVTKAAAAGP